MATLKLILIATIVQYVRIRSKFLNATKFCARLPVSCRSESILERVIAANQSRQKEKE